MAEQSDVKLAAEAEYPTPPPGYRETAMERREG